ncbi:apolipoprotein Bb, tandem duplicate 1 [Halichoeres trimaculatus]|uniref:apolipoprotein Bb, tandem duplicate 1 n=1 Tax=Halichoeres trimaculatus TaxID=147232 RepID=UPI003D9E2BB4
MGDSKLCLLLLLSTSALAFAQDEDQPTCLLAKRYKTLHKYEYLYEAESLNAITGASNLKNGPKGSCKVEIEVPQSCSYIVRTTGCSLSEVVDMDAEGNVVFGPAAGSDAFAAEMEKYPLKVVVEGVYNVKLYPEEGETTNILNVKRGIITALAVPLVEEEKNKLMPTIHGMCKTYYTVNAREDIATDISLERDLSGCDKFVPIKSYTSPLALPSMNYALSKLVRSTQSCNYKFDNEKQHMTSGSCTEKHIFIPFSHKGEYGVTNVGKQALTLVEVTPYNERIFETSNIVKGLHADAVEDKSVIQDKDAGLSLLGELAALPENEGHRRADLFQRLVIMVRGMKAETLSPAIPEALAVSRALTYQVLAQCGTPECSSAIMQIFRTLDTSALEVDAGVFALGLVSNPSPLLINDMLEMAKYKPSKPIMYALSNVVKRYYKAEGKLIPEIHAVAEFMTQQLGDCSGDKDKTFMTLRVIGNMAAAVGPASPALRAAVIQCVNQPAAHLSVQQAAIQAYRLTRVPEEGREVLMQVLLDGTSPIQKRVAAYLVLMKDPQPSELAQLAAALPVEQDNQAKSFVISHVTNILSSTEPETLELRQKILDALQGNQVGAIMDPTKFSRNYKVGSVEGNMIFEGASYLPKEVMLEMTLKAFGYDVDMMEIGMEGKGFEPTVETLFGENGFFPDTALKMMYFVSDNMPLRVNEILQNIVPALKRDRMKRQATQSLVRDLSRNLNKLVRDLTATPTPEAMVYLRILGNELGYLNSNEMEDIAYSAVVWIDSMFKMFPTDLLKALMTKADNAIFGHYMLLDNEFFLPTSAGVPLRIALSGTIAPGIRGGINIAPDMSEVAFKPSAGFDFELRIGSSIPEYVKSGLEMHTNLYHESGLAAKVSFEKGTVKLAIPAAGPGVKLLKMTNNLVAVTGSSEWAIPPLVTDKVDVNECTPFFAGMNYCTALQYYDAFSQETAPYFPFTGDSKFEVELRPTGEVSEYTAMLAYELLREGEEGRQKVDSLKFVLRAEGENPAEATVNMKYNRRKNVITADAQIPDYDLEVGLRLGVIDGNTKGKGTHSISLDLINKNIPQLSLVGRAKIQDMKEAMLQGQVIFPLMKTDATVTANLKRAEEMEVELKSEFNVMGATSEQKIAAKYDGTKVEVVVKSDVNAETAALPRADMLDKYGNGLLDMQVGQTDMKVRHILTKFSEAANNYMEKYGADIPYIQNFRVPDMPEISLPETLFMKAEAKLVYYPNDERLILSLPLPLGGKSTEEMNFPPALTTPSISLPQYGLEIVSMEIPIPELIVPESLTVYVPLFGKAEVSAMLKCNLYDMEASVAAGKDVVETPSYSAKFEVTGTSPIDILSVKMDGSWMLATTDAIKANFKTALVHKLIEATINVVEEATITDKINLKSSSKIDAKSLLGLTIALEHTGMAGANTEEISADSNLEGMWTVGPAYGKATATQSFTIAPFKPEAKIDSSVEIDSTVVSAKNTIAATLANGELLVVSNTNAYGDILTNAAELSFKDSKLSLKLDTNALALGMKIRNQAEASAGAGEVIIKVETNADQTENHVYSLLTAALNVDGLSVSSDANVKLLENEAVHKATLKMNKDGLTTSGTTTLQSPLALENTFDAVLDASKATLNINNKAALQDIKVDNANTLAITLSGLDFHSKAEASASEYASYTHDITIDLKPYTASANVNNNLKLLTAEVINEAVLKAELYKMDLTGTLKAIYGEEEIKHTYQVTYADLAANAKCSTTGQLFGAHMSHNTELEVIGLAARLTNDARFNSQPVRFDNTIRCSVVPFDFNLDAIFNADGDMTMYGKHSAQLYGKLLLKAQPLALASSHEWRASVTQQLDNGFSLETTFDNKMDNVLSLQEQKSNFRMKSKVNEHSLSQDLSIYNTAERTGLEVSGTILSNILNGDSTENQEFVISGFLKYDKNTDSHVIQFPLIENLPALLEGIKGFVVYAGEVLQSFINDPEIRARIESLPQYVDDFVSQLNLEEKITQLKQYLSDITQEYVISMEDVEATLNNLKATVTALLSDLRVYIQNFVGMVSEIIFSGTIPETLIQKTQQLLDAITEEADIKALVMYVIDTVKDLIEKIDLEKLKGSSIAILSDIDATYEVKAKLQAVINYVKETAETFDWQVFVSNLKTYIASIEFRAHVDELMSLIPTKFVTEITGTVGEIVAELDILGKINTFYAKLRELIIKFEADKKVQAILEKVLEIIKEWKIEETIKTVTKMVKDADLPGWIAQTLQNTVDYLKTTDVVSMIQGLNTAIEDVVQRLKSLEYNDCVTIANDWIKWATDYVNGLITSLEIPQKLEATKDLVNLGLSTVKSVMESVREIRVAEVIKSVREFIDQAVFANLKGIVGYVKQAIADLDVNTMITPYLDFVSKYYARLFNIITNVLTDVVETIKTFVPEQKIISEIQQILTGLLAELQKIELSTPSFSMPLTDLVVPSLKLSMDKLEIPTQLDIPEFTILGSWTVQATTITIDDIKQKIIALLDLVLSFEIPTPDVDAFFGDLTVNYLPALPDIALPEISLSEISFPVLPEVPVEKFVKSLQVPEIKLPTIPTEMMFPCFGKLYGEIKVNTPIYMMKTSAELQNSTETETTPTLTGFFSSQGTSDIEILNYNIDSTARLAIPKWSRIVLAETLKVIHSIAKLDHQASLSYYGLSAQAQAKTTLEVTTTPYTGEFVNTAFIAVEDGMSASLETIWKQAVNLPVFDIKGETEVTQKAIARLNGYTLTLTVDNDGKGKINAEDGTHKSNLQFSLSPSITTLAFTGDTDSTLLKMKQLVEAEIGTFSYFKFNVRNEAEAPIIKNSLFVATGAASLYDLKVELKANHDTELYGAISGVLSNGITIVARPMEVVAEFQNKGNAKVTIFEALTAKIDLQNDYTAMLTPESQQINTVALARLNQFKAFWNVTVDNNKNEAGIFVALDGEANLDFLTSPISIPELDLPFVDFHTPAVSDLNLYEETGLKNILTTTEQTVDVDAKVVYKKSQAAPLVKLMGPIQIPSLGNLITELSFKSAIINLNANAGLYTEDDIVFRLGATTASVFDSLKAKFDGTTSFTTRRGIKLANSMSLENPHIEGTHDSTISVSTETLETAVSVATVAKIALPILNLEANQNLVAGTKDKPNALSTWTLKGDFNIPLIKAVGKAEAEHRLKLEGSFDFVSVEASTKANMDGTVLEDYLVLAILDNEANAYLNADGLRSNIKVIADAKLNQGTTKVIGMDVNENLEVEASLSRVYAVLKFICNNEANVFSFYTVGKHTAQATIDLAPLSSLTADIEIDMSQPTSIGDFTIYDKTVAEVTPAVQKISTNAKIVTPVYTTNLEAVVDGNAPVFKVLIKSSATSVVVLLEYDMEASSTASFENGLSWISKLALTHADLTMNVNHGISQALRKKRQADDSSSGHTLTFDITSPTFTDMSLRYAALRDGISASVSIPSSGFMGMQITGKIPSQFSARVYGRYPSTPEDDIDVLIFRSVAKDDNKVNLQFAYNMEAPKVLLSEMKTRLPSIISTLTMFADKYQITSTIVELKNTVVTRVSEAYDAAVNYDAQMSQLSIFFRNIIVQYQLTVQTFLDAVVKVLRETQFKLPGSDEMTTLPEVLKKLTSSIAAMLDVTLQSVYAALEDQLNSFVEMISNVKVRMPVGDAVSVGQVLDQVKTIYKAIFDELVDFVKNMESLDTMLVKIGETLKAVVEKSQEFVDSIKSDYLDAVLVNINVLYVSFVSVLKTVTDQISAFDMEQFNSSFEYIVNMVIYVVDQVNNTVNGLLQQASAEAQAYMKVSDGRLEIELPFPFQQ